MTLLLLSVVLFRLFFFFLIIRLPPNSTRTETLFPYTTLFRSALVARVPALPERRVGTQRQERGQPGSDPVHGPDRLVLGVHRHVHVASAGELFARGEAEAFGDLDVTRIAEGPRLHRQRRRPAGEHQRAGLLCGEIGRAPSELQSLMRLSYAVFCLKKKKKNNTE